MCFAVVSWSELQITVRFGCFIVLHLADRSTSLRENWHVLVKRLLKNQNSAWGDIILKYKGGNKEGSENF